MRALFCTMALLLGALAPLKSMAAVAFPPGDVCGQFVLKPAVQWALSVWSTIDGDPAREPVKNGTSVEVLSAVVTRLPQNFYRDQIAHPRFANWDRLRYVVVLRSSLGKKAEITRDFYFRKDSCAAINNEASFRDLD